MLFLVESIPKQCEQGLIFGLVNKKTFFVQNVQINLVRLHLFDCEFFIYSWFFNGSVTITANPSIYFDRVKFVLALILNKDMLLPMSEVAVTRLVFLVNSIVHGTTINVVP